MVNRCLAALGLLLLAFGAGSASAAAEVPAGPRLAVMKWGPGAQNLSILTFDASGSGVARAVGGSGDVVGRPLPFQQPSWSPDGSVLAYTGRAPGGGVEIFLADLATGSTQAVPKTIGDVEPVLSPDGRSLAFARSREKRPHFNPKNPIGSLRHGFESTTTWLLDLASGEERRLTPWRNGLDVTPSSFSPDGSLLGVTASRSGTTQVRALRLSDGSSKLIAPNAESPAYSPDGSRIAFISFRDRNPSADSADGEVAGELYTAWKDGTHLQRLTRTGPWPEWAPSWDPSGRRIAYAQGTAPEALSLGFGFTNVIMEINYDGSCRRRVFGRRRRVFGNGRSSVALFGPAWQPGPGRRAGPISC